MHVRSNPLKLVDFGIYNLLTTVTASFRSDSPKTMMNRTSLTWTSSNTARTATGSTAAIKLPNRRKSSSPECSSPSKTKQTNYKQNNLCISDSNDRLGYYRKCQILENRDAKSSTGKRVTVTI